MISIPVWPFMGEDSGSTTPGTSATTFDDTSGLLWDDTGELDWDS